MNVAQLRQDLKLSLEEFGRRIGLASKGQVYKIERDNRCSVAVALRIEELSEGKIPASTLNPDIGLIEQARGISANEAA